MAGYLANRRSSTCSCLKTDNLACESLRVESDNLKKYSRIEVGMYCSCVKGSTPREDVRLVKILLQ